MHVEPDRVVPETARVLKRGGKVVFADILPNNPFARLYGLVTGTFSPIRPRYITVGDINRLGRHFAVSSHREYYLLSVMAVGVYSPGRKRIAALLLNSLHRIDQVILFLVPPLRRLCWMTVIRYER